jgi:uncharacterized protein (DUF433 family)
MAKQIPDQRIVTTAGVAGGKPRISGRRITVQNIAIWHETMGKSVDEIADEYDLAIADIYAALAYYFEHKAEIDASLARSQALVKSLRDSFPSKLNGKLKNDGKLKK